MSVVIIGGNECMSRKYTDICQEHGCKAKVFPKETGPLEKKIGSPDLMILFTNTVSHKMIQGAMKAAKDVPAADIVAFMEDWIKNCVIFFAPYTLKYAKKSGRIPSAAAFVGEVMGLRPIMRIHDHAIVTETKVRGDKAIVPKILDLTVKEMIPQTPYCIVYGNDESVRDEMVQAMTKKVGYPPVECFQIGAAIAINAGPKVTGVIFKAQNK